MTDVKEAYLKTSTRKPAPKPRGGRVCTSCGGSLAEDGHAAALAEEDEAEAPTAPPKLSDADKKTLFERALKGKRT